MDIHTQIDLTAENARSLQAFQSMFHTDLFAALASRWGGLGLNSTDVSTLTRAFDLVVNAATRAELCSASTAPEVADAPTVGDMLADLATMLTDWYESQPADVQAAIDALLASLYAWLESLAETASPELLALIDALRDVLEQFSGERKLRRKPVALVARQLGGGK